MKDGTAEIPTEMITFWSPTPRMARREAARARARRPARRASPSTAVRWRRKRPQPSRKRRRPGWRARAAGTTAPSAVADSRVDGDIQEVHGEVREDEEGREDEDDPL